MTELSANSPSGGDIDPSVPTQFSLDVQIGELPYILQGETPEEPTAFSLVVSLPGQAWKDVEPKIEKEVSSNSWFASQYHRLTQGLHLGEGRVGSVWVSPENSPDDVPSILVDRIQTDNRYLPDGNEYHNAKGVGSFILDNLCALADARRWRIYLVPLERDGRLTGTDLNDWYERRGFKFSDVDTHHMYGRSADSMMRLPKEPDTSQPILKALSK